LALLGAGLVLALPPIGPPNLAVRPSQAAYPGTNGKIAFVEGSGDSGSVRAVNPDGKEERALVSGSQPSWSPDGKRIAYVVPGSGVYIANADGTDPQYVTDHAITPDWSPDGKKLVFGGTGGLWIHDLATGAQTQITYN